MMLKCFFCCNIALEVVCQTTKKRKVVGILHTAASNTNRIFTDVGNCDTDLRYQTHFL